MPLRSSRVAGERGLVSHGRRGSRLSARLRGAVADGERLGSGWPGPVRASPCRDPLRPVSVLSRGAGGGSVPLGPRGGGETAAWPVGLTRILAGVSVALGGRGLGVRAALSEPQAR